MRCGFDPWVRKIPQRRKWQPTPVFLPRKSHVQRGMVVCSQWIAEELEIANEQQWIRYHRVQILNYFINSP